MLFLIMITQIAAFLQKQTNLTLATCLNNAPYCANCFYVYDEPDNALIFKSKRDTNHVQNAIKNELVAGTVLPDKLLKAKIQGVQFRGIFNGLNEKESAHAEHVYYNRFPFARIFEGELWRIELMEIKMTDNTLGFGKKIEWKKEGIQLSV